MKDRITVAVDAALRAVMAGECSILAASKRFDVARSSIHRALERQSLQSPGRRRGADHHAYVDGRRSQMRAATAHRLKDRPCPLCGGDERAMPTHCPAQPLTDGQRFGLMTGQADYHSGAWTVNSSAG